MDRCNDPLLTYIKSFGYNAVRLPRANVKPLQIWALQAHDLNYLGELTTLLVTGSSIPLPTISEGTPAANFSGKSSSDLKLGIGISLLSSILGAMGGSKSWLGWKVSTGENYCI